MRGQIKIITVVIALAITRWLVDGAPPHITCSVWGGAALIISPLFWGEEIFKFLLAGGILALLTGCIMMHQNI